MPQVELRTYRYFHAVVVSGSMRAAAELSALTQPAISRQIALLEQSLGVVLFHRHRSGMTLTPAGEALHGETVRLLAQADRTERAIAHWRGTGASIRVACLDTTLQYVMAPFVAETGASIADLRPEPAREIYGTLDDKVDLAISTASPPRGKIVERLSQLPVAVLFDPARHAFDAAVVSMDSLAGRPVVIAGHGSAVESAVRQAAEDAASDLDIVNVVSSGQMAQASAASQGTLAITTEPPKFGLSRLPLAASSGAVSVTMFAVWNHGHPGNQTIRQVVAQLRDWLVTRRPWESPR